MYYKYLFRLSVILIHTNFVLYNCNRNVQPETSSPDALFRMIPPEESGIRFANLLQETDTFNAIFYEYYYNGSGLAIGDLNHDGFSDIFFGANMSPCRLYLNKGDLRFEDATDGCGIHTNGKWITGVSFVDINQDGWLDIYLCAGGNIHQDYHELLYISNRNKDHLAFRECAAQVGLADDRYSTQANFFDYDRDGDLDLYLVNSAMNLPNKNALRLRKSGGEIINTDRLYRNEGIDPQSRLPVFRNVSSEAGIVWDGFGLGSCVCDINRDGWPDIYVCNDYITNDLLYVNQGDGTFKEMIRDYVKHISYSTMGMDIADFNNDGLVDIFTLDMQPEDYYRKRIMSGNMRDYDRYAKELDLGYSSQYVRNMLQVNNGEIEGQYTFSEVGLLAGVFETDWSWAPLFADLDNDGLRDLFVGNGIPEDMTNMDFSALWQTKIKENPDIDFPVLFKLLKNNLDKKGNVKKPNVMYRNMGGFVFNDVTRTWGVDQPLYSTGSAISDLDNDGDLDLVLNNLNDPASVYENRAITRDSVRRNSHFLSLKLEGDPPNQEGIGTRISLFSGGRIQYYEHFPVRGFQSMMDPVIHFGLGADTMADSLLVCWPDLKEQRIASLPADQSLILRHSSAEAKSEKRTELPKTNKTFTLVATGTKLEYRHREQVFVDFEMQPLIPHQYSREGPGIAIGDINSDGLDDVYIGGSTGYAGRLFIQNREGRFLPSLLSGSTNYEDMGVLFFDADTDSDLDLYLASGGSGLTPDNPIYADRLFINLGKGAFIAARNAIPEVRVCNAQVSAADYDRDGDLDLFVCGRVDFARYPMPPRSVLLRNDSRGTDIKFTDVTGSAAKDLEKPGLVSAALWTDFDRDGWTDLILAGEWMPLTFFRNNQGNLVNVTSATGLENYTGWWNSLTAADFDKDGDTDYAAGNLGLNTQYKVSQQQPMRIVARDFDRNGTLDPVCSYYVQGKSYPIYHRNLLLSQIPSLKNRFKTYEDYARATMEDIFPPEAMKDAYIRDCRFFESAWIENLGNATFRIHALPTEAQFAPVFGMLAEDFDADGNADLLITGNSYSSNVYDGQYDASIGLYLKGDGHGAFVPVPGRESGFFVDGDAKGLAELVMADGSSLILAARNSGYLKVYRNARPQGQVIRLRNDDACADLTFGNGVKEHREFYYGSGYLSQSSRAFRVPEGVTSFTITTYKGETRKVGLTD